MNVFATYFDKNYLPHGLMLIESLLPSAHSCQLYILCLDDETFEFFQQYSSELSIRAVSLAELESADSELLAVKPSRSLIEYYFTITSSWCHYLMSTLEDLSILFYVDADLYFYEKVDLITDEMEGASVMIIPHRFSDKNKHLEQYGKFNVGLVGWRSDQWGKLCLADWRKNCIEWCYDRYDGDRFADQKYLDYWPDNAYRVKICDHQGLNVAYYNVGRHEIGHHEGKITVDGKPLVFFHFHKVERLRRNIFRILLLDEKGYGDRLIFKYIYLPYFKRLFWVERRIKIEARSLRYKKYRKKLSWLNLYGDCYVIITPLVSFKMHLRRTIRPFMNWIKRRQYKAD